ELENRGSYQGKFFQRLEEESAL
ncbi:hypothetical protein, partial [Bacillus subtilis]